MGKHFWFLLCFAIRVHAQEKTDSLELSLPQAEQLFLKNNLQLLAQQYNISAQRALVLQARLYPNPSLNLVQGGYNPQTHQWFETGVNGEQAVQVQQLILLAGKINKQVKIAQTNALLAEYNFYDLLRTLKYTLRTDFFTIYYLQQSASVYGEEIQSLEQISRTYEDQKEKGYIARSEVVRIKAQLYSLRSELNDLMNQIKDKESEIRLVLQADPNTAVVPQVESLQLFSERPTAYPLHQLLDSAYNNRTDLMIAKANVTLSKQNYAYQKALAVPDLTLGANYDRAGSYVKNANSLSIGFNIPLFNRNQGNIRAYKNLIGMNELLQQGTEKTVVDQVARALERALDADRLYQGMDRSFTGEFSQLARAVYENYVKRNIGLLDFLNFYDSYKTYIVQLNYILQNRATSLETINYVTATNFFNK